jgi:hypothetical protein
VGFARGKPLPLTTSAQHICIFRHALALDERRVKFLPEYVAGGDSAQQSGSESASPDVKEVWFPGSIPTCEHVHIFNTYYISFIIFDL